MNRSPMGLEIGNVEEWRKLDEKQQGLAMAGAFEALWKGLDPDEMARFDAAFAGATNVEAFMVSARVISQIIAKEPDVEGSRAALRLGLAIFLEALVIAHEKSAKADTDPPAAPEAP